MSSQLLPRRAQCGEKGAFWEHLPCQPKADLCFADISCHVELFTQSSPLTKHSFFTKQKLESWRRQLIIISSNPRKKAVISVKWPSVVFEALLSSYCNPRQTSELPGHADFCCTSACAAVGCVYPSFAFSWQDVPEDWGSCTRSSQPGTPGTSGWEQMP